MNLFEKLLATKEYQEIIKDLPEDERKALLESMKMLVDRFEAAVIKPIQNAKK